MRRSSYNGYSPAKLLLKPNVTGEQLFALAVDFSVTEAALDADEVPRFSLPTTHFCKML